MRGLSLSIFALTLVSASLVGCGGVAVNQDGRTVALTNSLERMGRVRVNLPVFVSLGDSASLPPPVGQYDKYLKLWYVHYPSPLALADAAPNITMSSTGYFEDKQLTKQAGFVSFRTVTGETGYETLFTEEFSKGTRAGDKTSRKQVNQPNGSFTAEVEKSGTIYAEVHKGKEVSTMEKAEIVFDYVSTVKDISITTSGKLVETKSFAPGGFEFSANLKDSAGFSVDWSEKPNEAATFTMTGQHPLLPAKGTYSVVDGKGTLSLADGTTLRFVMSSSGIRF